jgi:hypothetical protein
MRRPRPTFRRSSRPWRETSRPRGVPHEPTVLTAASPRLEFLGGSGGLTDIDRRSSSRGPPRASAPRIADSNTVRDDTLQTETGLVQTTADTPRAGSCTSRYVPDVSSMG